MDIKYSGKAAMDKAKVSKKSKVYGLGNILYSGAIKIVIKLACSPNKYNPLIVMNGLFSWLKSQIPWLNIPKSKAPYQKWL